MRLVILRFMLLGLLLGSASSALAAGFVIAGADAGGGPHVVIWTDTDDNGKYETLADSFYAFPPAFPGAPLFSGGVRVAAGDLDGDGNDELVTAQGPGGSLVRIWSLSGGGRVSLREEFAPFGGFTGGIFVAVGDFDGSGVKQLVTAADAGGGPHVIVWKDANRNGRVSDDPPMASFFAYPGFAGGVRVAAGNVDNAGGDELITAPGPGGGPNVKVWTFTGGVFQLIESFFAYDPAFAGGVYVAAGAVESAGSGGAEIITGAGAGGASHVRIFTDSNSNGKVSDNPLFDEFIAYPGFAGGVRVAAGDTDNSGFFVEILTVPGPGGGPHVRIFDDTPDPGSKISDNPTSDEFFAFSPAWAGGAFLAFAKVRTSTYSSSAFPQTIADVSTLVSEQCLPAGSGRITDLDVGLSIFHSFDGDLDVTLTHAGTTVALFNDVGGTNEGFFIRLSDEAGTDISGASNPKTDGAINGTFNPGGAALLSAFDNVDAGGCWQLSITDDSGGDTGTLFGWTLYFSH